MKKSRSTRKELVILCAVATLGTLALPLAAEARTVDSVTVISGGTAETVYSGESLEVTKGVEVNGNHITGIRAVDNTTITIGEGIYVHGADSTYNNSNGILGDSNVKIKVGGDIRVESEAGAERVRGIYIEGTYGSSISDTPNIEVGGNIFADGINTIGIFVEKSNANAYIKVDGDVTASNRNTTGISTVGTSRVYVGGSVISSYDGGGGASIGISVSGGNSSYVEVAKDIIASGNGTYGLSMGGSGTGKQIKVGGNVVAGGEGSTGINTNGNDVIAYIEGDVTASGKKSKGIGVQNGAQIVVDGKMTVSGEEAKGIALSDGSRVKVGQDFVVSGIKAKGIDIEHWSPSGSGIQVQMDGNFVVSGSGSYGIYTGNIRNTDLKVTIAKDFVVSSTNSSGQSVGIFSSYIPLEAVVGGKINVSGTGVYGIYGAAGSNIGVVGNVEVNGAGSTGIQVMENSKIQAGGVVTGAAAANAIGLRVQDSAVTLVGDSSIGGASSTGVRFDGGQVGVSMGGLMTVSGDSATGFYLRDNSGTKATFDGPGGISVGGSDAVGLKLGSGTEAKLDGWSLNVTDSNARAGIELGNNTKLELTGFTSQADGDAILLMAKGQADVTVDGSSHLVGDVLHDGTTAGQLTMTFDAGSSFTGKVAEQGAGSIQLDLNNAVWYLSGNSNLHQLTLNNGAEVHLNHSGSYHTLTAKELHGDGGLFKMEMDVRSMQSDKLVVTDASSGNHLLDIHQKDGYEPPGSSLEGHGLVLGSVNGDAVFEAKDREGSLFYQHYELGSKPSETSGFETDWYLDKIVSVDSDEKTTTTVKTIMGSTALNYHTWRNDNDQLLKRLGDLRHLEEGEQGAWFRVKGAKIGRTGKLSFENKYTIFELGYDKVLKETADYIRYGGVALSYGDGSSSYGSGSGENHNRAVGIYGTQIGKKGHYLDMVLKYSDLDNDFNVIDTEGKKISGDYDNRGIAFTTEYGRKNVLQQGWYIEPQVQLTLGYLKGGSYLTSNRVRVEQSNIKSLLGRLGFQLGRDINARTNVYVKANVIHEFLGDYDIMMTADNNERLHNSEVFDDTWFEYGIGAAIKTGKNNHIYLDLERSTGSDFAKDWHWNVGARWEF